MIDLIPIIENVHQRYNGNLFYYYNLVMNAPNAYGPYHNARHMFHVPWETYDGCIHMGVENEDLRCALIAGLMHDFDHTCKRNDDDVNIERAIHAIHTYALEEDRPFLDKICRYVRATRFPYKEDEQFTANELILRDADQSQTFSPVWIHSTLYGLGQELEMSYLDMLKLQRPFLENLKFHTLWGKHKFESQIPARLALVDKMLDINRSHPIPEIIPMP